MRFMLAEELDTDPVEMFTSELSAALALESVASMLRFLKRPPWDISSVSVPWGDRPSIYAFVTGRLQSGRDFSDEYELPDSDRVADKTRFKAVPGALDGAFSHHFGGETAETAATTIFNALRALTERATDDRAQRLYAALTEHSTIDYVDALLPLVAKGPMLPSERVGAVARWLATRAPDREPVKTAVALLGVTSEAEHRDLILTLGKHEEFTLYAAAALQHSEQQPEALLWELAQHATGWGRVHLVERLAATEDRQIKAWLLRTGYRNSIMFEYTALICARTGNLIEALRAPELDAPLLKGAGAIIAALISGGPAEGIEAYADGAEATELYLGHLRSRDADLEDFNTVVTIERFLEAEPSKMGDFAPDWAHRADAIRGLARVITERPDWHEKALQDLSSDDRVQFWNAAEAARALGIDMWEVYFQRLERGGDDWYFILQTNDANRADRVVALAEQRLPLNEIASGPSDELGLGPEFASHSALDFVLQDLRRFPGKGWPLIRAGLQSAVTRNRNMALRALAAWDRSAWPVEAEFLLRTAVKAEPNEETRRGMQKLLSGEPLTDF